MTNPRTLEHPPIKEAVLEVLLKFSGASETHLKKITEYGKLISSRYPHKESIVTIDANFANDKQNMSRTTIGYAYFSADRKTSIQIRVNGFAYAQTNESYKSWEVFKPLAFEEFQGFIDYMQPENLKRISLRFINEIKILPVDDIKEYFHVLPNIEAINLPIKNFVSRVEVEDTQIGAVAIISQLLRPPFEPTVNVYLDIDVIINMDSVNVDVEEISKKFDDLRLLKNRIFFSALTEKTINSYS